MLRKLIRLICFICLVSHHWNTTIWADEAKQVEKSEPAKQTEKKKNGFKDFDQVVKDSQTYKGFFNLYLQKTDLYCEILPFQLNQPFLCMMSVSRGIGMPRMPAGTTLDEWLLVWKRLGNRLHLIRQNVRFRAKKGTPMARTVDLAYNDSVLFSLEIDSIHPQRNSLLVNISPVFISDLPHLAPKVGSAVKASAKFDKGLSSWGAIKAFPKNVELKVAVVYDASSGSMDTVPDSRGMQLEIHYSLVELPDAKYRPRLADDRLGHFLTVMKDYSFQTDEEPFVRYVNRWHLQKADMNAKVSPPKKPIIFYIEKTVPHRFRSYIRQGILEWNKAFEKIGFVDAIEVRVQQDDENWDPEDARYNTVRWIAGASFAIGPSRVNPLSGQILDADILINEGFIRSWQRKYMTFFDQVQQERDNWIGFSPFKCEMASGLSHQMNFMATTMAIRELTGLNGEMPEEYLGQALKALTMHEVGHTLGLRHNFKASSTLSLDQLNDKDRFALIGSVMDYGPVNIAPKSEAQGNYYTTTIGPWDYWAIEYAYKPIGGNTLEDELPELGEIAARAASPELAYGTDGDVSWYRYRDLDPLVNRWDLGNDPLAFARQRMEIISELWTEIVDKVAIEGVGYQRVRRAFGTLLNEYSRVMFLATRYIGGQYHHRDHRGDPNGRLPFVPVSADKQREALKFLKEHALSDKAFDFPPELLNSLAISRWSHWGIDNQQASRLDYPLHRLILNNQRQILDRLFYPNILARIQDTELKFDKANTLTMPKLFSEITGAVWSELGHKLGGKRWLNSDPFISSFRRGLQREHLKILIKLVLEVDSGTPEDARSLAWQNLGFINGKIGKAIRGDNNNLDDYTSAHLGESQVRIQKALDASFQIERR